MKTVDLVRLGTMAMQLPEVGRLYTHLVEDALVGRPTTPGVDNYAKIMGVQSRRTVSRALALLNDWGLVARTGSRRSAKYTLLQAPNLVFCEAVVSSMFGQEVLEDVQMGMRRAQLSSTTGHSDPVAEFAAVSLLAYYGDTGYHPYRLPEPSDACGQGYATLDVELCPLVMSDGTVVLGQSSTGLPLFAQDYVSIINEQPFCIGTNIYIESLTQSPLVILMTKECGDILCICLSQKPNVAVYPPTVPAGFQLPRIFTKAAQAAESRRRSLPETSSGFVYWKHDDLVKDTEFYQTIVDLLTYGNQLFRIGEKLNWQLYIDIRTCLCEEELSPDVIRKALKAASIDPFWKDKASVGKLCKDPNRIRDLSRKSGHDPYVRSTAALPQLRGEAGDAIAF